MALNDVVMKISLNYRAFVTPSFLAVIQKTTIKHSASRHIIFVKPRFVA